MFFYVLNIFLLSSESAVLDEFMFLVSTKDLFLNYCFLFSIMQTNILGYVKREILVANCVILSLLKYVLEINSFHHRMCCFPKSNIVTNVIYLNKNAFTVLRSVSIICFENVVSQFM